MTTNYTNKNIDAEITQPTYKLPKPKPPKLPTQNSEPSTSKNHQKQTQTNSSRDKKIPPITIRNKET